MNLQNLFAERIGGATFGSSDEIYKFERIKRAKAQARKNHPEETLLDFGVGEPDQPAPEIIRNALKQAVDNPANRGYADNGIKEFKLAAKHYLQTFFNVNNINPDTQIVHSIGSKPALAMMPLCFINPGEISLVTVPGYPVIATHTKYMGGRVVQMPLLPENHFYPDLQSINPDTARRAKLIYVNYPNNPTGAVASENFFDELIAFANKYNILIIHDAAYATLVFNKQPLSILSRPGADTSALELHSMSKSYNMTGWRLGFIAGNKKLIQAYSEVKDNSDSGQFKAIQLAACSGINSPEISQSIKQHYHERLKKLVACLNDVGFKADMPGGTFYLYTPAPKGAKDVNFGSAADASEYLIKNHLISTVPWDDAGAYLRFSATFEANTGKQEEQIIHELNTRLKQAKLQF
jgi:LL-diaminopimelate aminotransferase